MNREGKDENYKKNEMKGMEKNKISYKYIHIS